MASLMNGLSSMGAAVSSFAASAGLEQQKADLANQTAVLASQLAGARETAGRAQAGDIAAKAATQREGFESGESALQRGSAETIATGQQQTSRDVANINANRPSDVIKTLRDLGMLPNTPAPNATSTPSPSTNAPAQAGPRATPAAPDGSGVAPDASTSAPASPNSDLKDTLIAKTLGLGVPGSDQAIRSAIAADVKLDPAFKYKSAGAQGAEVENRLAVAKGTMTDPAARASMAAGIASYQLAPLSGFAAAKPGGPETMAQVMQLNPDYQEARYPEVNKAMSDFGAGKSGAQVRFLNVGVQHLATLDEAAAALGNHNVQAINALGNAFQTQFGAAAPTTFDALKQIVGTEVEKAVAGGIGSSADRDRIMKALSSANSPEQLAAVTSGFRSLMAGQLSGLKTQYEDATGFTSGPFAFEKKLAPATAQALSGNSAAPAPAATQNARPPLTNFLGNQQ